MEVVMAKSIAGAGYGGAGHFANEFAYEVQRTNHFEISLNLSGIIGDGTNSETHIRLSTKDVSAPKISSEAIPLKHGNETVKVASAPSYEDLQITVYDTIGVDQINVLQTWFDKVFDHNKKIMGRVTDYKTQGTLYMYSPDCTVIRQWNLFGVWPRSFSQANNFSYDSTEAQTITLELSVDRFYEELKTK